MLTCTRDALGTGFMHHAGNGPVHVLIKNRLCLVVHTAVVAKCKNNAHNLPRTFEGEWIDDAAGFGLFDQPLHTNDNGVDVHCTWDHFINACSTDLVG